MKQFGGYKLSALEIERELLSHSEVCCEGVDAKLKFTHTKHIFI